MTMTRMMSISIAAAAAAVFLSLTGGAAGPACDPDNGGLKLPQGFCARSSPTTSGRRGTWSSRRTATCIVSTNTSRAEKAAASSRCRTTTATARWISSEHFGSDGATGVALHNGYVYMATHEFDRALQAGGGRSRAGLAGGSDRRGADRSTPACRQGDRVRRQGARLRQHRRTVQRVSGTGSPAEGGGAGSLPAARHAGGIWQFDENKLGQKQTDGKRYATGLRQMPGLTWYDNSLWVAMHNRDSLDTLWPGSSPPSRTLNGRRNIC